MKCTYIISLAIAFTLLTSTVGFCNDKFINVIFGNGVYNTFEDADLSKELLKNRLVPKLSALNLGNLVIFNVAHNPTLAVINDLLEAFTQNQQTDTIQFWKYLAGLDLMPDYLQHKLKFLSSNISASIIEANPAVQEHIEIYNGLLCGGNKVVVVAHSQGNMFANLAFEGLNPDVADGFGIVSVANPDSYVAGGGPYTTIVEDIVIFVIPFALPANLNNFGGTNPADWSGHEFGASYMAAGKPAESKILEDIETTITSLEWPEPCIETLLYVGYKPSNGQTACLVWDMKKNALVSTALKNDGTPASFPCPASEISTWKSGLETFGSPAVMSNTPSAKSPLDTEDCRTPIDEHGECRVEGWEYDCMESISGYNVSGPANEEAALIGFGKSIVDTYSEMMWKGVYETEIYYPYRFYDGPKSYHIWSLTNAGGHRGRPCSVTYSKKDINEQSNWHEPNCNEFIPGKFVTSVTDINYIYEFKSPFSDNGQETVDLSSYRSFLFQNPNYTGVSCDVSRVENYLQNVTYKAGGIVGDSDSPYLVAFYSEKAYKGKLTNTVCSRSGLKCASGSGYTACDPDADTVYGPVELLFDNIKAFSDKAANDPMNLNPFGIPGNNGLSAAMRGLRDYCTTLYGEQGSAPAYTLEFLR